MTIYFRGGEDIDFVATGTTGVGTTAGQFRSGFGRCALGVGNSTGGGTGSFGCNWSNVNGFSAPLQNFWFTAQVNTNPSSNSPDFLRFFDTNGVPRLCLQSLVGSTFTFAVFKQASGGARTQLGANTVFAFASGVIKKLDVNIQYGNPGTITFYINNVQQFTFTGDLTTDGLTGAIFTGVGLGCQLTSNASLLTFWSEVIVSDVDTRQMNLVTLAPVANGNTHNFDIGTPAAANVNETTLNDTTLDGASTAGLIDQYTTGGLPSGTWLILDVAISARMQRAATGPSKMDLGFHIGAADYWSTDIALTTSFANYVKDFPTDPSTGATWLALPTNIGCKSVT